MLRDLQRLLWIIGRIFAVLLLFLLAVGAALSFSVLVDSKIAGVVGGIIAGVVTIWILVRFISVDP